METIFSLIFTYKKQQKHSEKAYEWGCVYVEVFGDVQYPGRSRAPAWADEQ